MRLEAPAARLESSGRSRGGRFGRHSSPVLSGHLVARIRAHSAGRRNSHDHGGGGDHVRHDRYRVDATDGCAEARGLSQKRRHAVTAAGATLRLASDGLRIIDWSSPCCTVLPSLEGRDERPLTHGSGLPLHALQTPRAGLPAADSSAQFYADLSLQSALRLFK